MADKLVELKAVSKYFQTGDTQVTVLRDINLLMQAGEFTALIGQSGSGKSTLLNIISTLDRPTSGEVLLAGKRVETFGSNALAEFRNRTLGFIFQFHYLLPELSVLENVLIPQWIAFGKKTSQDSLHLAEELLDKVGVAKQMHKKPRQLSGGEQQRVAIARALVNRPPLILADEPTGSLDSGTSVAINKLLRTINQEYNTTFLIVTHDRHIAAECDRVLEIADGQIEKDYLTREQQYLENWKDLAPEYCLHYGCPEYVNKIKNQQ